MSGALTNDNITLYEQLTGYAYDVDKPDVGTMASRVQRVIDVLQEEADRMVLMGDIRSIHVTMDINELDKFSDETISAYNDLFYSLEERGQWENAIYSDRNALMNKKLKRLELLRYYEYVRSVLFLLNCDEYTLNMNYYKPPSPADVLDNGVDFYFFRVGEATIEGLVSRYETYELLVMLSYICIPAQRAFILGPSTYGSKDEIAALVIDSYQSVSCDPRSYLTHTGPLVVHRDNTYNLSIFDADALLQKVVEYGVWGGTFYNGADAHHKVVLAMLDFNFFLDGDEFREFHEQVINATLATDNTSLTMDAQYPLFFGTGDGVSRYYVYDQLELAKEWNERLVFWNPIAREKFSLRQVRSLLMMDIEVELREAIIRVMNSITLPPLQIHGLDNISPNPDDTLHAVSKKFLIQLFNAGSNLSDLYDSFHVEYRAYDLTSAYMPTDPELRLRIKVNTRDVLFSILKSGQQENDGDGFESLWVVDGQGVINTTDYCFTLKGLLLLMLQANSLGLYDTVNYFANHLMCTAEYYMKQFYAQSITALQLEFSLTNATIRNNDMMPGDFSVDGDNG